jgi:sigma-B regulation protein RsbQ
MSKALIRNNVRVVGGGDTTVVLAHGFGSDQTAWRHQCEVLAPRHRLVLFDHVGAGSTDPAAYSPQRYRSLHSYAADLLEIIAALKLRRAAYIGHSMGAMIGLLAALEEPELFERMVFIGGSPRYLNEPGYRGGFEQADLDAIYAAMASNYQAWVGGFAGPAMGYPERADLAAEFARTLSELRPDIALAMARVIFQSDHRAALPSLRVPTLILQTEQDIAVPVAVGEYMASQLAHARLKVLPARGHLPHLSAPAAVNEALLEFLG